MRRVLLSTMAGLLIGACVASPATQVRRGMEQLNEMSRLAAEKNRGCGGDTKDCQATLACLTAAAQAGEAGSSAVDAMARGEADSPSAGVFDSRLADAHEICKRAGVQ